MTRPNDSSGEHGDAPKIDGAHAILGVDVVSFSKLHDDDQVRTIENLVEWIDAALHFRGITEDQYRWSPAGDGGYLTFAATSACRKAIDVAFSICENARTPQFCSRNGEMLRIRMALHVGTVQEAREFGQKTNIWGLGINNTARILTLANPSQVLMSRQYFDLYIKDQREADFEIGESHWRTVKHDVQLEVMNVNKSNLGLSAREAGASCWQDIGGLWRKTVKEYTYLIKDALRSGDSMAALAAAKFLLELNEPDHLEKLSVLIGRSEKRPSRNNPLRDASIFSQMPPKTLNLIIASADPQLFPKGAIICNQGDRADHCYFVASGAIAVEIPGQDIRTSLTAGEIIGEFSLWIPAIGRTATLRAEEDCLLLTISNERFLGILKQDQLVAEMIYGRIKERIVSNVLKSPALFPRSLGGSLPSAAELGAECEMFEKGARLDLKSALYIVYNGSVKITRPGNAPLTVKAAGDFGADTVVGIVSDLGEPDGDAAEAMENMVAVVIPRSEMRALQQRSEEMSDVWNAIAGRRQGKYLRRPSTTASIKPRSIGTANGQRAASRGASAGAT